MGRAYGPGVVADLRAAVNDVPAPHVPAMARIHGTLNAFGFTLAGPPRVGGARREPPGPT
ncbi:MAG TPA: hypothetical protein VM388_11765 [Acidimicrobiales bacterium]|nr:hypothetical protein [Acidimicrobiales bacterium]